MECVVEKCPNPARRKRSGLCGKHAQRKWRHGDVNANLKVRKYCTIADCDEPVHGTGLCSLHYDRRSRRGSPTWTPPTEQQRYHAKVAKGSPADCWPWTAGLSSDGYGKFVTSNPKRHVRAHRYGWTLANGSIPNGLQVLHRCDNPVCQNPGHWFLGTGNDNMRDKVQKGRHVSNPYHAPDGRFTTRDLAV